MFENNVDEKKDINYRVLVSIWWVLGRLGWQGDRFYVDFRGTYLVLVHSQAKLLGA
jgi:hypothetical protein